MTTRNGFSTTRIVLDQLGNGDRTEYMRRWIFCTPWFTVRLHHIQESDYGWPHNHPWNFLSLVLSGGYTELLYAEGNPVEPQKIQRRKTFSVALRKCTDIHKVKLPPGKTAWTLCVTDGARLVPLGTDHPDFGIARWGFFTPQGYVPWEIYDPNATEEL